MRHSLLVRRQTSLRQPTPSCISSTCCRSSPATLTRGVTPDIYSYVLDKTLRQARSLLEEQLERIKDSGARVTDTHVRRGPTADEVLDLAENLEAGLIVVGSRGLGSVKRLVVGSVSEAIVHAALYPVLVLRGGLDAWPPEKIIIGDDGSEAANGAGKLAARMGSLFDVKVLLMRVYPQLPEIDAEGRKFGARMADDELRREEHILKDRAVKIENAVGIRPKVRIAVSDPAAALLQAAEEGVPERTLIAVGSRGLDAIQRLRLGSVSTKVLHAAKSPVLVYPPPQS
jgi:nucleotide-binding universal stress UspA family protein